jgi:Flp pilus assembly protein TadD
MVRRHARARAFAAFAILGAAGLAGCQSALGPSAFATKPTPLLTLPETQFYSSDEALQYGKTYFKQGDYGRAEASYRRAVELLPQDPEALLGLAASYDRLRRFDLADRAYGEASRYIGSTPAFYNNLGYSYILRGDLRQGRAYLLKAYELDPGNPVTANNLAMLKNSADFPVR